MYRFFVLLACVGATLAQRNNWNNDPKTAAILNEQRYLSGDGTFGSQYTQEDGVQFKEESDQDGNRRGSYSYVDPTGQRRTVTYTAGKNGFQATGDHLPQAPAAPLPVAPKAQYQPLPQYNSPAQPQQQQWQQPQAQTYQAQPQPQWQQQQQVQPQPQWQQQQQQAQPQPQWQQPQAKQYQAPPQYTTTPAPHRYFPPGKLSLNRSPDGYSYTFNQS